MKTLLCALVATTALIGSADASLIAHYTFDTESGGTTPDSVGAAFATLGDRVAINTSAGTPLIGAGAFEMLAGGNSSGPADGATTSNSFSWSSDARTVVFWWKSDVPNTMTGDGTFVSFGDNSGAGKRFDVKQQGASNSELRVEVQGNGGNANPGINDGEWHHIAVVVPDGATTSTIDVYVDGSIQPLAATNGTPVATGAGPLTFGDSILTVGTNDRVPDGFLDDLQLYDEALTLDQVSFLYNNPGSVVIPEPASVVLFSLATLFAAAVWRR